MTIVSSSVLDIFNTTIVFTTCATWIVVEIVRLRRHLRGRRVRDEIFGSIIGLVIMTVGLVGIAWHYWT